MMEPPFGVIPMDVLRALKYCHHIYRILWAKYGPIGSKGRGPGQGGTEKYYGNGQHNEGYSIIKTVNYLGTPIYAIVGGIWYENVGGDHHQNCDAFLLQINMQGDEYPGIFSFGDNYKVQHFSDDTTESLSHGSCYIHMDVIDTTIQHIGQIYIGDLISYQTTFWNNHLHLDYRRPHSLSGSNVINPFTLSILQVSDTSRPILKYLYVDYSCHGNASVQNLNFLNYRFDIIGNDTVYRDTTYQGITFKKLKLLSETPSNDLDDPHILISGNCKVRFILEGHDNFFSSTDRGAPYELILFLLDVDSGVGVVPIKCYKLRFDSLLGSADEVHQEEDVYHVSAPLISGIGAPQYYRLYPCDSVTAGFPSCVITDTLVVDTMLIKTENLDEGMHRIRISVRDYNNNTKTADVHFYIRKSNWVDFCRGLISVQFLTDRIL